MKQHCLYRHFDSDERLLYVGISNDPAMRTEGHKQSDWAERIARISVERFDSRKASLEAERIAIVAEKPEFNVQWSTTRRGKTRVVVNKLGRPLIHGEATERYQVTIPPSVAEALKKLGEGSLSVGIVKVAKDICVHK